jgi:hypothetical protein
VFINELFIYISYFKEQLSEVNMPLDKRKGKYFSDFYNQLLNGINYYRKTATVSHGFPEKDIKNFNSNLNLAQLELESFSSLLMQ